MKIKDLKKMCNDNVPLLESLKYFNDSDIVLHEGKWDFELNYGEAYCTNCYGGINECGCDEPENKDEDEYEGNFFYPCAIKYIDTDGEECYDSFDEGFDEFQGYNIGNEYNIFFDSMGRTIHIFKNKMICDGVVEGFFDFDNYQLVDGELERNSGYRQLFLDSLKK
jgi:hypothetical protein